MISVLELKNRIAIKPQKKTQKFANVDYFYYLCGRVHKNNTAIMKAKLNTWINVLLTAILGMLGYSCGDMRAEYGTPMSDFTLEGTVSNEDDEPLQDIQVVHRAGWKNSEGNVSWMGQPDTLYTDADGKFQRLYGGDFPLEYRQIIVNDTAGVYASDSIETTVSYSGGDQHWYHGKGELKADFVLKKK